jgi:hypothetical protein
MRKGIALITVVWILAILLILIGILAFLTSTDIAYTFFFNKKRIALGAAEYGKNEVVSKIPEQDLLQLMIATDSLYYDNGYHAAFMDTINPNRYYLVSPMPFPTGTMKWGTGGRWFKLFDFTVGGRCVSTAKGNIERVINVGAAYVHPYTDAGSAGHTMY